MKWGWQPMVLLALPSLAGCFSAPSIEQPLAAGLAAASYHCVTGDWPERREELLAFSNDRWPLRLRRRDEVWLRENNDGSATITWMEKRRWGSTATPIRVVPPGGGPQSQDEEATPSSRPAHNGGCDYAIQWTQFPTSFGRRMD